MTTKKQKNIFTKIAHVFYIIFAMWFAWNMIGASWYLITEAEWGMTFIEAWLFGSLIIIVISTILSVVYEAGRKSGLISCQEGMTNDDT